MIRSSSRRPTTPSCSPIWSRKRATEQIAAAGGRAHNRSLPIKRAAGRGYDNVDKKPVPLAAAGWETQEQTEGGPVTGKGTRFVKVKRTCWIAGEKRSKGWEGEVPVEETVGLAPHYADVSAGPTTPTSSSSSAPVEDETAEAPKPPERATTRRRRFGGKS